MGKRESKLPVSQMLVCWSFLPLLLGKTKSWIQMSRLGVFCLVFSVCFCGFLILVLCGLFGFFLYSENLNMINWCTSYDVNWHIIKFGVRPSNFVFHVSICKQEIVLFNCPSGQLWVKLSKMFQIHNLLIMFNQLIVYYLLTVNTF